MPRANDKDCYFFSHDANARNDPKVVPLRSKYGAEGYGVYWMIIEILREQPNYKYPISEYYCSALAMQMNVSTELVEKIIEDCCSSFKDERGTLLCKDKNYLYSKSLLRRMQHLDEIRDKRSLAARSRWVSEPAEEIAPPIQKESISLPKVEQVVQVSSLPSIEDITTFTKEHGYNIKPIDFLAHLQTANVTNWKKEVIPFVMKTEQVQAENRPIPQPKVESIPLDYIPNIGEVIQYGKTNDVDFDKSEGQDFLTYFSFIKQKGQQFEAWKEEMKRWGQMELGWE